MSDSAASLPDKERHTQLQAPASSQSLMGGQSTAARLGAWADRLIVVGAALLPLQFYGTLMLHEVTLLPSEVCFGLAMALVLIRAVVVRENAASLAPTSVMAGLLVLAGAVSLFGSIDFARGSHLELRLLFDVLLFVLLAPRLAEGVLLRRTLGAVILGAVLASLFALYQFVASAAGWPSFLRAAYDKSVFGFPRVHSTMREPLYLDSLLLLALAFSAASIAVAPRPVSFRHRLAYVLLVVTIGLTLARGAYFALGLEILVIAVVVGVWKGNWRRLVGILLGLVLGVGVTLGLFQAVAPDGARVAVSHVFSGYFDSGGASANYRVTGSLTDRYAQWSAAVAAFRSHPLTGVGIGNFPPWHQRPVPLYPPNDPRWTTVSNTPLEVAAEMGLAGFLPWALLLGGLAAICARAIRRGRNQPEAVAVLGLSLALAAIVVQFQSFSALYQPHYWLAFAMIASLEYRKSATPNFSTLG